MKIEEFKTLFSDCSLSKAKGSFLSDKNYKFDSVRYVSLFVYDRLNHDNIFNKKEYKKDFCKYIEGVFNLKNESTVSINYLTEVLNILEFANIIAKTSVKCVYKIVNKDALYFISQSFENAYIFLFLLTYYTFKNDNLLDLYFLYKNEINKNSKKEILLNLQIVLCQKYIKKVKPDSVWSKMLIKYPVVVLGYVYDENYISRMLNIDDIKITMRHLATNNSGQRTPQHIIKDNLYITQIDEQYIKAYLRSIIQK